MGGVAKVFAAPIHPRVCREKLSKKLLLTAAEGNTPAYAGKTRGDRAAKSQEWEHPRVCGENLLVFARS